MAPTHCGGIRIRGCHDDGPAGDTARDDRLQKANVSHKRSSRGHFVDRQLQKSLNAKRSVVIGQHKTSVSLEAAFWKGFTEIAATRNVRVSDLAATVNKKRQPAVSRRRSGSSCSTTIALWLNARKATR
jgi:predicted DNA-binding ribbon-helix-helix protein